MRLRSSVRAMSALLAAALAVPSIGVGYKFGGRAGIVLCLLIAIAGVVLLVRWGYPRLVGRLSDRSAHTLMLATLALLTVGLFVVYPLNQAHVFGAGNDEADGMNVAASNLLHGRYLYLGHTWAGNPIVPWPGSVFLAVPFVLLGNSAYQVVFWLGTLYLVLDWYLERRAAAALALIWSIIVLSPIFLDYFWSGSDVVAAAMFVTAFSIITVKTGQQASRWHLVAAGLLGVALSSRANFALAYPAVMIALYRARGIMPAVVSASTTVISFSLVTLPFLVASPANFTPLTSRTLMLQAVASTAPTLVVGLSLAAIVVVILVGRSWDWLANASLILAVPIAAVLVLTFQTRGFGAFNWYPDYGITYEFFAAILAWKLILQKSEVPRRVTAPQTEPAIAAYSRE